MATHSPINIKKIKTDSMADDAAGSLDVSWLLQSKKAREQRSESQKQPKEVADTSSPNIYVEPPPDATAPSTNGQTNPSPGASQVNGASATTTAGKSNMPALPPPIAQPNATESRSNGTKPSVSDENKTSPGSSKGPLNSVKSSAGRRGSWFSLGSKKSSSTAAATTPRSASVDAQVVGPTGPKSPQVEFGNPFDKKGKKDGKKEEPVKQVIGPISQPRRQSVLVHAGQERKLENTGFLSSALRRLSSSNNTTLGKGAGSGAVGQRKIMNVDPNRERVKIADFDQSKLKRVAFCVDVEIAGYGAQADEEHTQQQSRPATSLAEQERQAQKSADQDKKDTKDAKYKEKGEGAALRNPQTLDDKESPGTTEKDAELKVAEKVNTEHNSEPGAGVVPSQPQSIPTTKKKEKKKRSEAERKERRERKKRQAEANGLVPLELSGAQDDDSDSSPNGTPAGASTPSIRGDSPTTDPLRIYKRCCQLRESAVLDRVKEQVSRPSATLAEAPGTVGILDLSGTQISLTDITTLGDWLAVVPVRKLVMDDCNLSDESLRIVLAGLAGCKSAEQVKLNRKLPKRAGAGKRGQEQMGVVEKLSIKNNTQITNLGWKHIALFMHMSRSLRAIDLSGIPFPKRSPQYNGDLSRTSTASSTSTNNTATPEIKYGDLGSLVAKALSERFGERLEELILSRCGLATSNIAEIIDCAIKRKIRRLGIAENKLTQEGIEHVIRYVKSGVCEGLDLGGNDLHGTGHLVANAVDEENPLFALSLVNCNLTPSDLSAILSPFAKLKNFKFIDVSQNHDLFSGSKNAVTVLRRSLPKLKALKRIHINDVDLTSEHVIVLAEMLPDCPELAHISILDNQPLIKAMNSKEGEAQEEACAFLASLMTAARVSRTIIAIELEVPSSDSSEVVKALASQIVAYSLRNMEYSALDEVGVKSAHVEKGAPEVLLHIVGHMEGYEENHDNDEPAPDEDYMIASTGIVKALGVCLGTKDQPSRTQSRNISPSGSGVSTPKQGSIRIGPAKKPKNVSLQLCDSARKIRMRLRPALVKEDRAGNDMQYRRLWLLDSTLERMIQRFEDEYPETKIPALPSPTSTLNGMGSPGSSLAGNSMLSASMDSNGRIPILSAEEQPEADGEDQAHATYAVKMSRTSSNTSLAAKALTSEEGRMHRLGQTFRREVLRPTQTDDYAHGTSESDPPEPVHMAVLRTRLEELRGDELRERLKHDGAEKVISDMKVNMEELRMMQEEDPAGFERFKESQLAAQLNSGV